jgi:hypothetical protein
VGGAPMKACRALSILAALGWIIMFAASVGAISREEIVNAAPSYEEHAWVAAQENIEGSCGETDWVPAVTEVGPQVGIPYCWGGSVTIEQFDEQIAAGYGAGSLNMGLFPWCSTGVDCSGYVSQLWQVENRVSTREIHEISVEIDATEMLPGDVFNQYDYHVILFVGEDTNGDAIVSESTTGECMGVCRRSRPWSDFSEYTPYSYLYLDVEASTQEGSQDDPIWIQSFPFRDSRSTSNASSDVFDFYSAAPETDESGPERIYAFYAETGGTFTAVVADAVGVDIDLHLLSSFDPDACLVRDDRQIEYEITSPGTYYLVADTFRAESGTEYAGSYQLAADFDGELGEPEEESGGCSCGMANRHHSGFLLMAALWLVVRRRRS